MKNRNELREMCVKILYQVYILEKAKIGYDIDNLIKEQLEIENEFLNNITKGVLNNQQDISKIADKYLIDWEIDRLSKVDKAILSIGIYELLYTETPSIVAINESLELAHKYSDDAVVKMINACLDKIYHQEVLNGK